MKKWFIRLDSMGSKASRQIGCKVIPFRLELGSFWCGGDESFIGTIASGVGVLAVVPRLIVKSIRWRCPCFSLQQRAFTEVFRDDSGSPANYRTSVQLTTPSFKMAIRFPIPDLRSDQERGPWFKKSLQKEVLHLEFSELEFKTEYCGSLAHEQLKLELTFKELLGELNCSSCFVYIFIVLK